MTEIYLIIISVVTVLLTVYDKQASKKQHSRPVRVPEKVFFLLAFLGAALPEYITMRIIRHKTRHRSFMWGLPAIAVFNALCFIVPIFIF